VGKGKGKPFSHELTWGARREELMRKGTWTGHTKRPGEKKSFCHERGGMGYLVHCVPWRVEEGLKSLRDVGGREKERGKQTIPHKKREEPVLKNLVLSRKARRKGPRESLHPATRSFSREGGRGKHFHRLDDNSTLRKEGEGKRRGEGKKEQNPPS